MEQVAGTDEGLVALFFHGVSCLFLLDSTSTDWFCRVDSEVLAILRNSSDEGFKLPPQRGARKLLSSSCPPRGLKDLAELYTSSYLTQSG